MTDKTVGDYEDEMLEAARALGAMDLSDDPDAAAKAGGALAEAKAIMQAFYAIAPIVEEAKRAEEGR